MDVLFCAFVAICGLVSYLLVIFTKRAGLGLNLFSWVGCLSLAYYAIWLFAKIEPDSLIVWTGEQEFSVPATIVAAIGFSFLLCIDEKGKRRAVSKLRK